MASLAYGTINIETLLMELLQLNSLNDYRRRLNSIILHCDDFNGNSTPNRIKRSPSYLILLTFNRISSTTQWPHKQLQKFQLQIIAHTPRGPRVQSTFLASRF